MPIDEFDLEIVTPAGVFLKSRVTLVELLTQSGQIGVMAGHARLTTVVDIGDLAVHRDGRREVYFTGGGFARIEADRVSVMVIEVDAKMDPEKFEALSERVHELMADTADTAQINAALDMARQRLATTPTMTDTAVADLARQRIVSKLSKRKTP